MEELGTGAVGSVCCLGYIHPHRSMCVGGRGHVAGGTGTQPTQNSVLPPGSTRVSGRASALLGVAGPSLATHRPLLCGGPTYYHPLVAS